MDTVAPRKKRKKVIWAAVVTMAVLLSVGAWYFFPPSIVQQKNALVLLKSKCYYVLSDGTHTLFFSTFSDSTGLSHLSATADAATDSLVCGGFYVDKNGTIATSGRILKDGWVEDSVVRQSIKKEEERLSREIIRLETQLSGKSAYMGSHITEDRGFGEMTAFYLHADSLLKVRTEELSKLKSLAKSGRVKRFCETTIISGNTTRTVRTLVQRGDLSIVRLTDGKTPEGNRPLRLAQIDWLGQKGRSDNVRLHSLVCYMPLDPTEWTAHLKTFPDMFKMPENFQFEVVEGTLLWAKDDRFCTSLPLTVDMDGFPVLNRWGVVQGITCSRPLSSENGTQSIKVSAIRTLLKEARHADETD